MNDAVKATENIKSLNQSSPSSRGPRQTTWASVMELLGSMRFAISLLTLICIASAIGTVVRQNEPWVNYVNQFGPFWAGLFEPLGLFQIYNAPWFIAVMAFLVTSTSLCVYRNTPKMIKEMRVFRENMRENSLKAFAHRWEGEFKNPSGELPETITEWLKHKGYKVKLSVRDNGTMVAAKAGSANRFGYIAAHVSIVVICVGGLLDSGVPMKIAIWATGKQAVDGSTISDGIPAQSRFSTANPSYRANLLLPEGQTSKVAVLNTDKGLLVQDLPFELTLKQFRIDFYSTGMPKLFASDVEVFDPENGNRFQKTIEVNKPLIYKGVTVFQSSFDDGGTRVVMKGIPLQGNMHQPFQLTGEVGGVTPLVGNAGSGSSKYNVEFTGFKSINVESMPSREAAEAAATNPDAAGSAGKPQMDVFKSNLASVIGPGVKDDKDKKFTNIGPSITYKLRDEAGQAREFQNYMLPIDVDGGRYFLAGVRDTPTDSFKYLRLPVDEKGELDGFMRFRAALQNPQMRDKAALKFAERAFGGNSSAANPDLVKPLGESAMKAMATFAGDTGDTSGSKATGLQAIAAFIDSTVPEKDRQQATDVVIRILQGSMWELYQMSRVAAGLPEALPDEFHGKFVQDSQIALSDLSLYGAPVMLQLDQFEEVKASVFQVAKAPGQWVVYLGCLFLVIGVFSMFYIRERRAFFWVTPHGDGSKVWMGFSTTRQTLDFEKEYQQFVEELNSRSVKAESGGVR